MGPQKLKIPISNFEQDFWSTTSGMTMSHILLPNQEKCYKYFVFRVEFQAFQPFMQQQFLHASHLVKYFAIK